MPDTLADSTDRVALVPFDPAQAHVVASWVQTDEELLWLAPSTVGPLTPDKVVGWSRPDGDAFVLSCKDESPPLAYGELNPMRREADHYWLGHVIVAPAHRGQGVGQMFVRALVDHAFDQLGATRMSLIVFPGNDAAIQCYRRVGFKIMAEEFHRFGPDKTKHRFLRLETRPSHR